MKKSDIIKELKSLILDITLLTESEFYNCIDLIPEIAEPWWTKSDGYLFDSNQWKSDNESDPMWKQVVYKRLVGSARCDDIASIGVRPVITTDAINPADYSLGDKIFIGLYSFTIIYKDDNCVRALCDSIISRRRVSDAMNVRWENTYLRSWLFSDGLIRLFASPGAISDWSCISKDALFYGINNKNDPKMFEWIIKQTFSISNELQKSIDIFAKKQFENILPSITNCDELESIKKCFWDEEIEPRISNIRFGMIKESHFLDWKYRLALENKTKGFGVISEWVEADRTKGSYCYINASGSGIRNFYPNEINNIFYQQTCKDGINLRPLIFVQTSKGECHNTGDLGYLFSDKVLVLDVNEDGVYVVPTVCPIAPCPLYEIEDRLRAYHRDLCLWEKIPKRNSSNWGSIFN